MAACAGKRASTPAEGILQGMPAFAGKTSAPYWSPWLCTASDRPVPRFVMGT